MEIFLVAAACLLALGLAWFVREAAMAARGGRLRAGSKGESLVGEMLDLSGGADRLDGIVVGKTLQRSAQIDHLVRGNGALVVIETKYWRGAVSGGVADEVWFLTRPGRPPQRRRNPLRQVARQARIVSEYINEPDVPVRSLVVMAGRSTHEAGVFPEGVISIFDLKRVLPPLLEGNPSCPEKVEVVWASTVAEAFEAGAERRVERYIAWVEGRFGEKPWHIWLVVAFSFAALAWSMSLYIKDLQLRLDDYSFM